MSKRCCDKSAICNNNFEEMESKPGAAPCLNVLIINNT